MPRDSLLSDVLNLDKKKAVKYIIYGLIVAVLFGTVMMISRSIDNNAGTWEVLANEENIQKYNAGIYGYEEYLKRAEEIDLISDWMNFQDVIFMNIARVGVNISLVFIAIGFISLGVNPELDDKTKRIALILGGIILIVLMMTTFFTNISVTVS
ncbi:MAG: hypothetical protein GF317_14625 [Candidatus Lokiarchaeota archaeon]|nr:hypothetical protein [Candidatus Lokiarchaeota archaeon]MBD3200842.1 hypothetical protein [Candidatus Lokiarchaeota archaeon]